MIKPLPIHEQYIIFNNNYTQSLKGFSNSAEKRLYKLYFMFNNILA